ncbi:MAG: spore cortex biosynthesis protein YabQ [Bacillota bacterium]|nr:spore cortex biosynthesis protein YabQ [Bacillota bacterium]MDW7683062.1 spore cortex biosynthesis protein YabQ [Bacillota bacterium]
MQDSFIVEQVGTFVVTIALGLVIGFTYDTLRALKTVVKISRRVQFFTDLFYWLVMTALTFVALLASNWGEVRAYVFIGLGTGGVFYVLVLSKPWFYLVSRVFSFIAALLFRMTRPLVFLLQKTNRTLKLIYGRLSGNAARGRQAMAKIKFTIKRKKKE